MDDDFMSGIVTSLSVFQFTANLEHSGSRIPDAYPVKLFTFQKLKTELKIINTALTLLLWVKVLFWPKNADFFPKKMLT